MTLPQAMAFAKEEFISSLQYMDLHQLGEITAFRISILSQVTSGILACKYINEAQRFAILVKTLPVTGNTMVFVTAVQELLIDMVAHAARVTERTSSPTNGSRQQRIRYALRELFAELP